MTDPTPLFSDEENTTIRWFVASLDNVGVGAKLVARVLERSLFSEAAAKNFAAAVDDITSSYYQSHPDSIVSCGASLAMVVDVAQATRYFPDDCLPTGATMAKIREAYFERVRNPADD